MTQSPALKLLWKKEHEARIKNNIMATYPSALEDIQQENRMESKQWRQRK